jgi:hypothetical protein
MVRGLLIDPWTDIPPPQKRSLSTVEAIAKREALVKPGGNTTSSGSGTSAEGSSGSHPQLDDDASINVIDGDSSPDREAPSGPREDVVPPRRTAQPAPEKRTSWLGKSWRRKREGVELDHNV